MADIGLLPIRTRILTDKDDIFAVMDEYVKDRIGPDDVLSLAESVLAIMQGRIVRPENIRPCFASPFGMQALMNAEGKWRVAGAFLLGAVMKLLGRGGWFYRLGGRQAALIDDVTGTMPPYDKHIVYGPDEPYEVACELKERLGCFGAVVADVNDLKRARIVSCTAGMNPAFLSRILVNNPFGNASQKTPIVIIKNYAKLQEQIFLPRTKADEQ